MDFGFCALSVVATSVRHWYNHFGLSAHYRTRGGEWRGGIAAPPYVNMVSAARKGINDWSNHDPVN